MKHKLRGATLAVVSALVLPALALSSAVSADDHGKKPLSVEVLWELKRIGSPVISPQGTHIVAPVTEYNVENDEGSTQLWLFSPNGDMQRPLTAEGFRASEPVFSPDGKHLAFISQRQEDDAGQIYVLPMDAPGEATRITNVPTGVNGLKWVGQHLYFVSNVWPELSWDEMKERMDTEKNDHISAHQWNALPYSSFDRYLDENRESYVFRVAPTGGNVEPVTQSMGWELSRSGAGAGSYDVDTGERYIAFVSDSERDGVTPNYDIFLAPLQEEGEVTNLTEGNLVSDSNPTFNSSGNLLAYTQQSIPGFYADTAKLKVYDVNRESTEALAADWDRSVTNITWTPDSRGIYSVVADEATNRVYHIDVRRDRVRAITAETDFGGLSIANNNVLVGTNQSFLHPAQLVSINTRNGSTTRLDTFNDDVLANVDLGTYESVTYEGHNGKPIQMWVHYPPGFDSSKKYPLFLLIHGGPHNAISNGFHYRWNAQTFASWGYVTAWHNFHGSSSFGQEFADSINPDWVTAPYEDTIKAAKWFQEKSWIDNDRLFAGGASYGGYLSTILLGKPHPFDALLIHAPVYNMYSQMSADFAVHADRFGHYWERPEIYQSISPHYFAENFNTPALLIHGLRDLRVPVGQSFELFRTLQSRNVESRMIYFPDENHWILKPNNSIYWYNEVKRWVEQHTPPGAR